MVECLRLHGLVLLTLCMLMQWVAPGLALGTGDVLSPDPEALSLSLTPQERAWLAAHPVLRVGGPKAFPPFFFYDAAGAPQGMALEYLRATAQAVGLTLQVEPATPWPETLSKIKDKAIDVIPCIARSADREAYLEFSEPYLSFPLVILARRDAPFIGGLEDLRGRKVALVRENVVHTWLEQGGIVIEPLPVGSPLEALQAVSDGVAAATIDNLAAATYLIDRHGLTNLKVAAPTPYRNYDLHLAVRKDWPELLGILNKALEAMSREEHARLRGNWLSVRYEHGIKPEDVLLWLLLAVVPVLAVLGTIAWRNRRLRQEILHRKQAEEALNRERMFTEAVLDSVPGLLYLYDDQGRLLRWNRRHGEVTGYSDEELASMHLMDWYRDDPATQEKIAAALGRVRTCGMASEEAELQTKTGKRILFSFTGVRLEIDGRTYFTGMGIDITERKRMEQDLQRSKEELEQRVEERTRELREANAQLRQLDELKSTFISLVSHELRTPLTSVLGYAKIISKSFRKYFLPLVEENLPLAARGAVLLDNLQVIASEGTRLSRLINDLLDINKIESGKVQWHDQPMRLAEEAQAAIRVMQNEFAEKPQLHVALEVQPDTPLVLADRDRIRQVFMNLLSNALKFSAEGKILVRVGPDSSGSAVEVRVQDRGIGIAPEDLTRIFDRFYQVEQCPGADKAKGSGLGLAISRQIVEHYGGRLWAESSLGQGASFIFVLPRLGAVQASPSCPE